MVNHFSADLGILKMHNFATFRIAGLKDEKVVRTGNSVISADGKTWTYTFINAANPQQTIIQVYEKQ
jgi:hypothetical protein